MKKLIFILMVGSLFMGCTTIGCCLNKEDKKTETSQPKEPIEAKIEPIEPTEGAEGVMPDVPDVKKPEIEMNILDGNISSGSTTLKTQDIIKDCKKECVTFTISSDEWCDCMHQCSQYFLKVFYRISLGDMNMKIYMEECSSDKDTN